LSDDRCDLFSTWWIERNTLIEVTDPGPSGSTNCCDVGSSFTCRGLNACVAFGGLDAMSLGYEPLLIDFFRMAEVKPSFCPVCTSASKIADATEIDAITVSAQAVQRTMDRVCHQG
jgi:hypothetical protein